MQIPCTGPGVSRKCLKALSNNSEGEVSLCSDVCWPSCTTTAPGKDRFVPGVLRQERGGRRKALLGGKDERLESLREQEAGPDLELMPNPNPISGQPAAVLKKVCL